MQTLSSYKDDGYVGSAYGVLMAALELLDWAVHVLDARGVVRFAEIVPEVTHEPDHAASTNALNYPLPG